MKVRGFWLLWIFGLIFFIGSSHAQTSLKLLFKVDTSAVFITTDNLDNVYVITEKNQVLKYNPIGKLLWNYSNKAFGKLTYIDVTDPMRILLYYSAIQQVVVLNNNLNEIGRFNFGADTSRQITLVATANSNGYWIYDQSNRQLQKLDNQFNDDQLSGNIYQQTGIALQPIFMVANDQLISLYDPKIGIMQFDRFGSFSKTIKIDSVDNFQVKDGRILFLKNSDWSYLDALSTDRKIAYSFDEKPLQVSEGNKNLAVLSKNGFKVYLIEKAEDEKK